MNIIVKDKSLTTVSIFALHIECKCTHTGQCPTQKRWHSPNFATVMTHQRTFRFCRYIWWANKISNFPLKASVWLTPRLKLALWQISLVNKLKILSQDSSHFFSGRQLLHQSFIWRMDHPFNHVRGGLKRLPLVMLCQRVRLYPLF